MIAHTSMWLSGRWRFRDCFSNKLCDKVVRRKRSCLIGDKSKSSHSLFLFRFARVGAFNSWLLPKLDHFYKQNTDNSPLRYGTNTIHIREKEKKVVSIFGNRVFMFFIEEPRIVCHVLCSKDLFSPPESATTTYVLPRRAELLVKLIVSGECDASLAPPLHHCSLSPYSSSSLFPTSSATCLVAF